MFLEIITVAQYHPQRASHCPTISYNILLTSFPSPSGGVRIKDHVSSPSSLGKWAVAVDLLGDKYATGESVTPCIVIATKASGDDRDD